jgi:hypothetical protein
MSFFGPPPPSPPWMSAEPPKWGPPIWDRPAEDTLSISVAMTVLLAASDEHALVFDNVASYPNGFTFQLVIMRNPNLPPSVDQMRGPMGHMVRVGFEFADGSTVTSEQPGFPPGFRPGSVSTRMTLASTGVGPGSAPADDRFDANGIPTGHVLRPQGGGGSQHRQGMGFWCFGLPPAGLMTIHADWPGQIEEVAIEVDASPIVEAATRSEIVWDREP